MPNIDPRSITELISYMDKKNCDIGTLASSFASKTELVDENNVKVAVKNELSNNQYDQAIDFFRIDTKKHNVCGNFSLTSEANNKNSFSKSSALIPLPISLSPA